jgi:hypothetical protein
LNIQIRRVEGFEYRVGIREFPIIIRISSGEAVEIAKKIDITSALLTKCDDEGVCFGYSQCVTGIPDETFLLMQGKQHNIEINVFKDDERLADFVFGNYCLKVTVSVFKKLDSGGFRLLELSDMAEFELR